MPTRPPIFRPSGRAPMKSAARSAAGEAAQALYDWRWRRLRARHLAAHPLCRYCEREGRVTAATVVDHIIPHRGDERLFHDPANLMSLCKQHHDSTKQREERRGG